MGKAKVMGLLDDLNDKKQLQTFTGSFCTMCELLGKLPKDEAEILQARLDDRSIAGTRIAVILKKNGYQAWSSQLNEVQRQSRQLLRWEAAVWISSGETTLTFQSFIVLTLECRRKSLLTAKFFELQDLL